MAIPFAALESRIDASIQQHMPNAVATHETLGAADVIFTREGEVIDLGSGGVVSTRPEILIRTGTWANAQPGDSVTVGATSYTIRAPEAAHGGAWQRLPLAEA